MFPQENILHPLSVFQVDCCFVAVVCLQKADRLQLTQHLTECWVYSLQFEGVLLLLALLGLSLWVCLVFEMRLVGVCSAGPMVGSSTGDVGSSNMTRVVVSISLGRGLYVSAREYSSSSLSVSR